MEIVWRPKYQWVGSYLFLIHSIQKPILRFVGTALIPTLAERSAKGAHPTQRSLKRKFFQLPHKYLITFMVKLSK